MVPSGLYASQGICPGIGLFYVPIVLKFYGPFCPISSLWAIGCKLLGGGSCSEIPACQNSKFYCKYISKFYWAVVGKKVLCTHVMCDDGSVNVCSVF